MGVQVIISHHVKDYETWKPVFDEHGEVRRRFGATGHRIYRALDDKNKLLVINEFPSAEAAQAFGADPSLREAMARAGVDVEPDVYLCEEVEDVAY